mmetsp:Transcript_33632/g.78669  ORF Transcript_33632/g.78669 Transcript_33632/m.78669 type:complete len:123 (+) Transcript_33632:1096-1464(+)
MGRPCMCAPPPECGGAIGYSPLQVAGQTSAGKLENSSDRLRRSDTHEGSTAQAGPSGPWTPSSLSPMPQPARAQVARQRESALSHLASAAPHEPWLPQSELHASVSDDEPSTHEYELGNAVP